MSEQSDFEWRAECGLVVEFAEQLTTLPVKLTLGLFDIRQPGALGTGGLAQWQQRPPEIVVVMFNIYTDADRILKALYASAVGYLGKVTPLPMLAELLQQVAASGSPMNLCVARHLIQHLWAARR